MYSQQNIFIRSVLLLYFSRLSVCVCVAIRLLPSLFVAFYFPLSYPFCMNRASMCVCARFFNSEKYLRFFNGKHTHTRTPTKFILVLSQIHTRSGHARTHVNVLNREKKNRGKKEPNSKRKNKNPT